MSTPQSICESQRQKIHQHITKIERIFSFLSTIVFYQYCTMNRPRIVLLALIAIALIAIFSVHCDAESQKYEASAKCIALNEKCTRSLSKKSIHCAPYTFVKKQSKKCLKNACKFCSWGSNWKIKNICHRWAIRHWCFGGEKPTGSNHDEEERPSISTPSKPSTSTINHGSKVVICMSKVQPKSSWTRKGTGLTWRSNTKSQIDPEGSGEMCFNFKVPKTGIYYLTAVTSAPHATDNNDLWVKLNSGLRLFNKNMGFRTSGSGYFKGYQNLGGNMKADILSSIDRDPHQFLTYTLSKGSKQTLCMSGRSSKFTVYKFVLVQCSGDSCDRYSKYIKDSMNGMTKSC